MAQFTIRIPDELHARIKTAATEDKRSLNGEVEWMLDSMLAMREIGKTVAWLEDGMKAQKSEGTSDE